MLGDLFKAILGGFNTQPQPAQFQQSAPPIPTPNPATSVPGAGQPLAQPIQSPNIGQQIGNHFQNMNWKHGFEDAIAGLAGLDPTRPALQAAAQGFTGARANATARSTAETQAAQAKADREREIEKHTADMRSRKFNDLDKASQISDREFKRQPKTKLDIDDRIQVEKLVNDYGQKLGLNSVYLQADERGRLLQEMQEYRKEVEQRLLNGETPSEVANDPQPSAPALTEPSPYSEPAQISTQQDFDALPPGSYFINPADQSILQKPLQ